MASSYPNIPNNDCEKHPTGDGISMNGFTIDISGLPINLSIKNAPRNYWVQGKHDKDFKITDSNVSQFASLICKLRDEMSRVNAMKYNCIPNNNYVIVNGNETLNGMLKMIADAGYSFDPNTCSAIRQTAKAGVMGMGQLNGSYKIVNAQGQPTGTAQYINGRLVSTSDKLMK